MRLYLSSYRLGNHSEELVRLVGSGNKRVAIINNASDVGNRTETERIESANRQISDLADLGFIAEDLDLRKYFNKEEELRKVISKFGMVWVRGGNTFILRRAFKQSGFDKIIKDLLTQDAIVYAGYSAGVCILAPSLRGLEIVDHPELLSEGYDKEIIWEGLGVINYSVAPHYRSDHPESADVEKEVAYMEKNNIPFKALRDGEVIIVDGDKETVFTL